MISDNSGIIIQGNNHTSFGHVTNQQGPRASADPEFDEHRSGHNRTDVGILTVLREETYAVVEMLKNGQKYATYTLPNGMCIHEAEFPGHQSNIRVVGWQTTDRGQESTALAVAELCNRVRPRMIALVGVAGGVHPSVEVGDVVVADSIIFYDPRRVAEDGVWHRGATRPIPVPASRAVQAFLASRLRPTLTFVDRAGRQEDFRVHYGPIGSGSAVITDAHSHIREFLVHFNEKVMGVETEAAGLTQGFHEMAVDQSGLVGWLVIRGISDRADRHKGHDDHLMAARHAAHTLEALLNFL